MHKLHRTPSLPTYLVNIWQEGGDVAPQPGAGLSEEQQTEGVAVSGRGRQVLTERREPLLLEPSVGVLQQTEPEGRARSEVTGGSHGAGWCLQTGGLQSMTFEFLSKCGGESCCCIVM